MASKDDKRRRLNEADILTNCALRFDGYKYAEQTGFDHQPLLSTFFKTGEWCGSDAELLATFFILQRRLCKWDLAYMPTHAKHWRAFRELFLRVCALEVPAEYRSQDLLGFNMRWSRDYASQLDRCIAYIRHIHATTAYEDEALPDLAADF